MNIFFYERFWHVIIKKNEMTKTLIIKIVVIYILIYLITPRRARVK